MELSISISKGTFSISTQGFNLSFNPEMFAGNIDKLISFAEAVIPNEDFKQELMKQINEKREYLPLVLEYFNSLTEGTDIQYDYEFIAEGRITCETHGKVSLNTKNLFKAIFDFVQKAEGGDDQPSQEDLDKSFDDYVHKMTPTFTFQKVVTVREFCEMTGISIELVESTLKDEKFGRYGVTPSMFLSGTELRILDRELDGIKIIVNADINGTDQSMDEMADNEIIFNVAVDSYDICDKIKEKTGIDISYTDFRKRTGIGSPGEFKHLSSEEIISACDAFGCKAVLNFSNNADINGTLADKAKRYNQEKTE